MKKYIMILLLLISALSFTVLSGCEKEEKEDLTDWSLPQLEEQEETVEPEETRPEETEQEVREPQPVTHIVRRGETIHEIAEGYGVSPEALAEANGLELKGRKSIIYPGQELIIPVK